MAAHNWRALRQRYQDKGIPAPMSQIPTMHAVLDAIEQLGSEAAVSDAKNQTEARSKLSLYYDRLYKPDMTRVKIDGGEKAAPPPGFSDEEVEASFDAFLNAGGR